jgi:hypothetical protein
VFTGLYQIFKLDLYGYILNLGRRPTPHTGESAGSAFTFVPYREFFSNIFPGLAGQMWLGQNYNTNFPDLRLDLPTIQVKLKGDFVWAGAEIREETILDGDNIGGRVGLNVPRVSPLTGGINPSGNMTQGGDFEGWFHVTPPANTPAPNNPDIIRALNPLAAMFDSLVDLNNASEEELRRLPGASNEMIERIVRGRPYSSVDDFRNRTQLSEEEFRALEAVVRV